MMVQALTQALYATNAARRRFAAAPKGAEWKMAALVFQYEGTHGPFLALGRPVRLKYSCSQPRCASNCCFMPPKLPCVK